MKLRITSLRSTQYAVRNTITFHASRFRPRQRPATVRSPQVARAVRLLRAVGKLGVPGAALAPPELLPAGARVLAQGYLNRFALPMLRGWLLPRWMHEQTDPSSPLFTPRSVINLMANQTARNWTALGIPGHAHPTEALIDTSGLLTPSPGGPSLDWWVRVDGGDLGLIAPSRMNTQQSLQAGLPVVTTAYEADGLRAAGEAWAFPGEDGDWAVLQVVLFNIADLPLTGHFYFALRPYNPEGIAPLYAVSHDGRELRADRRPVLVTWPRPELCHLSSLRKGDLFGILGESPGGQSAMRPYGNRVRDPQGFAHAALQFSFNIEPWEEAEFLAFMPMHRSRPIGASRQLSPAQALFAPVPLKVRDLDPQVYSRAKGATTLRWRELLGSGMGVSLPHRDLQNSWEANRAHLLALHDGDLITPGPDLYHSFWFRDAAYMTYALSICGYKGASAQLLRGALKRQRREGAFVSQRGEWDSTGQVLWAAARHLELHPDNALFSTLRPALEQGAGWLSHALGKGGGLMPPGISSEHLGPPDRYYWDNLWTLAGLEAARDLLGTEYGLVARKLRATLMRCWKRDAARLGRQALPAAPGRGADLGMVGTLAAWFPLRLLPPDGPLLAGTLAALEEATFHNGALFVHAGHSGWGTYLNMRIAGCRILGGLPGGWSLMEWLLSHASPTFNWPEGIHPLSGGGSAGDGHHGWASAEWLMLARLLLLDDLAPGDTLHVTPALPQEWLQREGQISVKDAPTRFGPLNYSLHWNDSGETLHLDLHPQWRTPPRHILWSLPGTIREARADMRSLTPGERGIIIPSDTTQVSVKRDD